MPKNNKPVMGYRSEEVVIEGLSKGAPVGKSSEDVGKATRIPLTFPLQINIGACCHEGQRYYLEEKAKELAVEDRRLVQDNQVGLDVTKPIKDLADSLRAAIHEFRLECHDCLNEDCRFRDDEYPVEVVKERAKQFKRS